MLDQIVAVFNFLLSFWDKLPQNIKDRIIALVVETWDEIFRMYFRQSRQEGTA
jgi:hypothetical protein